jgi:hypothetical protein
LRGKSWVSFLVTDTRYISHNKRKISANEYGSQCAGPHVLAFKQPGGAGNVTGICGDRNQYNSDGYFYDDENYYYNDDDINDDDNHNDDDNNNYDYDYDKFAVAV